MEELYNNKTVNKKIVSSCGKLYLAGEYSILTPGQSAILKNINIFMNAEINSDSEYKIYSDMFDYTVNLNYDKNYFLIQETINIVNEYVNLLLQSQEIEHSLSNFSSSRQLMPFSLKITGKMEKEGKKYGIGSSGSVTVLVIKAMSEFYNLKLCRDIIFKLASYILLKLGDNGSMGDIACIAYNSLVLYTSFDRKKISSLIKEKTLKEMMKIDWGYKITELNYTKTNIENNSETGIEKGIETGIENNNEKNIGKNDGNIDFYCEFLVGWTKEPAISKEMINNVKKSINSEFLSDTDETVFKLWKAMISKNKELIMKSISRINDLLIRLNSSIYSSKLKKLVECTKGFDICAKSSGAGGGDCGIAISFNKNDTEKLIELWENNGIELLYREEILREEILK